MTVEKLDESLKQFYAEARNKEGENYTRATLLSLRNGIKRFLNTPPNNLGIKFTKDPRFVLSNQMLDAKIKQLEKEGMQNTIHKPPIDKEDLAKLKTSKVFSLTKSLSLLRNVWFHVSLSWCRRGFEGQRNLKKMSFTFGTDATGCQFVTMIHDETTKIIPGDFSSGELREEWPNVQNQLFSGRLFCSGIFPHKAQSRMRCAISVLEEKLAALSSSVV